MTTDALVAFAEAVGPEGPVCVCGGRTQWGVGGAPAPGALEVAAPAGVVAHEPAEMVVRVRAGTTLAETQAAVGESGQWVPLEAADPSRATVGGLLAVGRGGYRRLRYGPVRDVLLEARFVSAAGELVRAGAPLVKNVTGYDLCRLMVGSLGTLGALGEVVLHCLPQPEVGRWWARADADPFALAAALYRPAALLWDGTTTWVGLEGEAAEVAEQAARVLGRGWEELAGPPASPAVGEDSGARRWSVAPGELRRLSAADVAGADIAGSWLAEIGVGVVHADAGAAAALERLWPPVPVPDRVRALNRAVKYRFDPTGWLNPGRRLLAA